MFLTFLEVSNFRNLAHVSMEPSSQVNVFYGENGSGKTSLLEAIHHLGLGRSFRTRHSDQIIQDDSPNFTVFGRIEDVPTGVERTRSGDLRIRIAEKEAESVSKLAEMLAIQLIHPDAYQLITAGPKMRRQFIDGGVFHVEHEFLPVWRQVSRILKQRNAALKMPGNLATEQITSWDGEFVQLSQEITRLRQEYIERLEPILAKIVQKLLGAKSFAIKFYPGWNTEKPLEECLNSAMRRDMFMGYTSCGPHRADLLIDMDGKPAQEHLSRGQMKLLVCGMRLAQAVLLKELKGKKSVFLIDDLPSELDVAHRSVLAEILQALEAQIFVTGIEKKDLVGLFDSRQARMFHVEHGKVSAEEPVSV